MIGVFRINSANIAKVIDRLVKKAAVAENLGCYEDAQEIIFKDIKGIFDRSINIVKNYSSGKGEAEKIKLENYKREFCRTDLFRQVSARVDVYYVTYY